MNGWTKNNAVIRSNIIDHFQSTDIISINETHLNNNIDDQPTLPGYRWYGHCRQSQHIRANKRQGGVGIFVNIDLYKYYVVSVIDQSFDGILALHFQHKISDFQFILFSCYLPPEDSPWGRDSTSFYGHLLSQIYFHNYADCVFICTDNNGRTGDTQDYISDVDADMTPRKILDEDKKRHGESFIDLLLECKLCIVNGRVSPECDNFTSKGRSIVDYICVQHNCIDKCIAFRVHDTNQLLSDFHLQGLIGDGCKPPHHALLELIYYTTIFNEPTIDLTETSENNRRRYKFNNISNDFMATPVWSSVCDALIQTIDVMEHSQSEINQIYSDLCSRVFEEMDNYIKYNDQTKIMQKKKLQQMSEAYSKS